MDTNVPKLRVENLLFSYGEKMAADHVSIQVMPGEFVGLIGPNGSGKSTVLKNVYRALEPDGGTIEIDGEDMRHMSFKESALKMAVVGQENDVPFNFKVSEIVAMGRTPHKRLFDIDTPEDKKIVHHALEHVGMADMEKRNYLNLSGGEKQRIAIARAILNSPKLIVADEPTANLDPETADGIMQLMRQISQTGTAVIMSTHNMPLLDKYPGIVYRCFDEHLEEVTNDFNKMKIEDD